MSTYDSVLDYLGYYQPKFVETPLRDLQMEALNGTTEYFPYQEVQLLSGSFGEQSEIRVHPNNQRELTLVQDSFFSLERNETKVVNRKIFNFGNLKTPDSPPSQDISIPPPPFPTSKRAGVKKMSEDFDEYARFGEKKRYKHVDRIPSYFIPVPRRASPEMIPHEIHGTTSTEPEIPQEYFSESVADEDFYDDREEEKTFVKQMQQLEYSEDDYEPRITRQSSKRRKSKKPKKKKKKSAPVTRSRKKVKSNNGQIPNRTGRKRKRKPAARKSSKSFGGKKSTKRRKKVVQRRFHSQESMIERFFEEQSLGWRKVRDDDSLNVILKSFKSGTSLNEAITSVGETELETIILKGGRRGRSPKTYVNSCSGDAICQILENHNKSSVNNLADEQISLELHYAHYIGDLDEVSFRKCDEVDSPIKFEMEIRRIKKTEEGAMEIHYQINVEKKIRKVLLMSVFYIDDYENHIQYAFGSIFVKETGWQRENEDEVLEVILVPYERRI